MGNKGSVSEGTLGASPTGAGSERVRGKSFRQPPSPKRDEAEEEGAAARGGGFAKRQARPTTYDDVALFRARIAYDDVRDLRLVERFVREGGDVNFVPFVAGVYDWTLLHWAAFFKATPTIKFLAAKGANINLTSAEGEVPAAVAKSVGASGEILRLLEAGRLLGGRV